MVTADHLRLIFTLVASLKVAPGMAAETLIYLAAPVLFWTMVRAVDERMLQLALFWIAVATALLSTGIVLYVANQKGLLPQIIPGSLLNATGAGFGQSGAATQVRLLRSVNARRSWPRWGRFAAGS